MKVIINIFMTVILYFILVDKTLSYCNVSSIYLKLCKIHIIGILL